MVFIYRTTREDTTRLFCDTEADVSSLPEFCRNKGIMPGSVCRVVENGNEYMMDSSGVWHKQGGEA